VLKAQLATVSAYLLALFEGVKDKGLDAVVFVGGEGMLLSQKRPGPASLLLELKKPVAGEMGALLSSTEGESELLLPALAVGSPKKLGNEANGFFERSLTLLAPL